jgi:tetratricopeptide (TPR) repeat protein
MLLVKKSKQVARLSPEELMEENVPRNLGFFGKIGWKIKNIRWEDAKQFLLRILERMTSKSRVLFLKLESRFGSWSTNIRNQRKNRAGKNFETSKVMPEDDIMKKVRDYKKDEENILSEEKAPEFRKIKIEGENPDVPKKENWKKVFSRKSVAIVKPARKIESEEPEKEIRPIISEKLVSPRPRTEMRDRLEELLIERIALNPKDIEAYERLGEYYLEIKSYDDSKECFKQVLKLNPQDRNAKYRMKRLENLLAKE